MMRDTFLLLLAVFVGAAWPVVAQQAQSPTSTLIVPGESLAGIHVGRTIVSVLPRMGQPTDMRTRGGETLYGFARYGLNVYVSDGLVRAVSTTNGLLRTPEGIALGSTLTDVRRAYGTQFSDAVVEGLPGIAFDQHGIAFGLDGVVVSIILVYPARGEANTRPTQAPAPTQTQPPTQAQPPAAPLHPTPAITAPVIDPGRVVMPPLETLRPYSPETRYMSVTGFLRHVVYEQTGFWMTPAMAAKMVQEQQRARMSFLNTKDS